MKRASSDRADAAIEGPSFEKDDTLVVVQLRIFSLNSSTVCWISPSLISSLLVDSPRIYEYQHDRVRDVYSTCTTHWRERQDNERTITVAGGH
jgi:hypothetical protein